MERTPFSLRARARSFTYAWAGLKALISTEHNMYIHLLFTLITLAVGCLVRVNAVECTLLIFSTALVWMAELFNTAIEKTADLISKERHPQIKLIKDVSAAAVLVAAVAAALIGCIIFFQRLF